MPQVAPDPWGPTALGLLSGRQLGHRAKLQSIVRWWEGRLLLVGPGRYSQLPESAPLTTPESDCWTRMPQRFLAINRKKIYSHHPYADWAQEWLDELVVSHFQKDSRKALQLQNPLKSGRGLGCYLLHFFLVCIFFLVCSFLKGVLWPFPCPCLCRLAADAESVTDQVQMTTPVAVQLQRRPELTGHAPMTMMRRGLRRGLREEGGLLISLLPYPPTHHRPHLNHYPPTLHMLQNALAKVQSYPNQLASCQWRGLDSLAKWLEGEHLHPPSHHSLWEGGDLNHPTPQAMLEDQD